MSVTHVFFDIGDVLFDEDVPHLYLFHSFLLAMRRNGVNVTWDSYHQRIQSLIRTDPGTAPQNAIRAYVSEEDLYQKIYREARHEYNEMRKPRPYGLLLDNIVPVLDELHSTFKLGIIANQHPQIVGALHDYGVAKYFDVVAIDEIVGFAKPDPRIFEWAIETAGVTAAESIMVGDRPEIDIAPSKKLGFGTVRFQRGIYYSLYDPMTDEERADIVVCDTGRLAQAVRQAAQAHGKD